MGVQTEEKKVATAEVRNIPISRLKWLNRPREREKLPANYFLLPKERKFPVRNKDGTYNCFLIRAAIVRAGQYNYKEVQRKAERLYARYCKKKQAEWEEMVKNAEGGEKEIPENEVLFVVKEKYAVKLSEKIELNDEGKLVHVVMPFAKFYSPEYGELEFTKELAEKIVENFENGYPHYDPPLNIEHDPKLGSFGKLVDLEVKEDGLYGTFSLTEEGKKMLEEKKFSYLSPEIVFDYVDKIRSSERNIVSVGPVIVGVALTNTPAQPLMVEFDFAKKVLEAYAASEMEEMNPCCEEKKEEKAVEEKKEDVKMSEKEQDVVKLTEELEKVKKELAEYKDKVAEYEKKIQEYEQKMKDEYIARLKEEWKALGLSEEKFDVLEAVLNEAENVEKVKKFTEDFIKPILDEVKSLKETTNGFLTKQFVFGSAKLDPEEFGRQVARKFNEQLEKKNM